MIRAFDLGYAYPGHSEALKGVSFRCAEGEILGLVGANGSGKSTLLAILAGLFSPTQGSLKLDGRNSPGDEKQIRKMTGLVMQDADLQIIGSTVAEDLCLAQPVNGKGLPPEVIATAEQFGLDQLLDRAVHELSWGQKKRLCLAATLHNRPKVLLLDEPFAGLDFQGIRQMRSTLAEIKSQGLTLVITAHDLEPVADLVDQWVVLSRGERVLFGAGEEVFGSISQYGVRPPMTWQYGIKASPWS